MDSDICSTRYAKLTSAYPGSTSDGLRTADLTDLAADSITTDAGPSSLQPSCVLVFGISNKLFVYCYHFLTNTLTTFNRYIQKLKSRIE